MTVLVKFMEALCVKRDEYANKKGYGDLETRARPPTFAIAVWLVHLLPVRHVESMFDEDRHSPDKDIAHWR